MKCPYCKQESCVNCETIHSGLNCSEHYHSLSQDKQNILQVKRCGKKAFSNNPDEKFDCEICYGEFECQHATDLKCHHNVCIPCIETYINSTEQTVETGSMNLQCPLPDCEVGIPGNIYSFLLKSKKGELDSLNKFILDGGGVYCPAGCENIIVSDDVNYYKKHSLPYKCNQCHQKSCLPCKTFPFHTGVSCEENEKKEANSRSALLRKKNTKSCPNCDTIIVRVKGCNNIKCGYCKHSFCWYCLKKWTGYARNENKKQVGAFCGCDVWANTKK